VTSVSRALSQILSASFEKRKRDRVTADFGSGGLRWCSVLAPVPWQQVVDVVDGMVGNASDHVGQPRLGIEVVELGGLDERIHDRGPPSAGIGAGEEVVLSSERYHPFILPMSGKSWKSITGGIRIFAARLLCVVWSSEQMVNFFWCWGPPA
jgi:hypothetical protein